MDLVTEMFRTARWNREPDLVVKGYPNRPVFSKAARRGEYRVVVGPVWTTYYRINKDIIEDQDSVKTENVGDLRTAIQHLTGSSL